MDIPYVLLRIGPTHVLIVLIVLVLLFGANKLPDLAKNVGKSAKILKKELRELSDDEAESTKKSDESGSSSNDSSAS